MKRLASVAFLTVMVALFAGAGITGQGKLTMHDGLRTHLLKYGTSSNWSGYAVETNLKAPQNNAVTIVSAQWVVPTVTCLPTSSYSAMWIGMDGYSDNTVEQTGTSQDCQRGIPQYYAWYEMYPHAMYRSNLLVSPGNSMSASVQYAGTNKFTLKLTNLTTGNIFTTTQRLFGAQRQSAEWVVEAPSSYFGVLPLSNFGTATFTNASTTINGRTGAIAGVSSNWQNDKIIMKSGITVKATPSALSTDGASFSDTWSHL
jgi:Peptidase A4 family